MISHDSGGLRFEMIACTKEDVLAFPPMSLVRTCEEERGWRGGCSSDDTKFVNTHRLWTYFGLVNGGIDGRLNHVSVAVKPVTMKKSAYHSWQECSYQTPENDWSRGSSKHKIAYKFNY